MVAMTMVACVVMFCLQSTVCGMLTSANTAGTAHQLRAAKLAVTGRASCTLPLCGHATTTTSAPLHCRISRPRMILASSNSIEMVREDEFGTPNADMGRHVVVQLWHALRQLLIIEEAAVGWTVSGPQPRSSKPRIAGPPLAVESLSDDKTDRGWSQKPPGSDRKTTGRDERYCDSDIFNDGCNLPEEDEIAGLKAVQLRGEAVQTTGVLAIALVLLCFISPMLR